MSNVENPKSLKIFSEREYQILKSVVDRIVPEASEVHGMDLALRIDAVLLGVRKEVIPELKLLLLVLEYGTPLLGFRFKWFRSMSASEKDKYLLSWERSRIPFKRMGFQALKRAALAAFYGSKESWTDMNYRGPWLDKGYPHDYEGKDIQIPE